MDKFHPSQGVRCFYVRGRHGEPVGLVMTSTADGVARMGWSLCKRNADTFRKSEAKVVAYERLTPIPDVTLTSGLRDTAMNRALTILAGDQNVPQTVRRAARDEITYRAEYAPVVSNRPQTVAVTPEPTGFFGRLFRALGL